MAYYVLNIKEPPVAVLVEATTLTIPKNLLDCYAVATNNVNEAQSKANKAKKENNSLHRE